MCWMKTTALNGHFYILIQFSQWLFLPSAEREKETFLDASPFVRVKKKVVRTKNDIVWYFCDKSRFQMFSMGWKSYNRRQKLFNIIFTLFEKIFQSGEKCLYLTISVDAIATCETYPTIELSHSDHKLGNWFWYFVFSCSSSVLSSDAIASSLCASENTKYQRIKSSKMIIKCLQVLRRYRNLSVLFIRHRNFGSCFFSFLKLFLYLSIGFRRLVHRGSTSFLNRYHLFQQIQSLRRFFFISSVKRLLRIIFSQVSPSQ